MSDGSLLPWLIPWGAAGAGGGGVPPISMTVIDTTTYSPHPINCVMIQEGPTPEVKHRITDWFGGTRTVTNAATAVKSSTLKIYGLEFRIPDSWKK